MEANESGDGEKLSVELDKVEAYHLLTFLLHAKFSEDVRLDICGSPTMNAMLAALVAFIGDEPYVSDFVIEESGGLQAPPSFLAIESRLKELFGREDVGPELKEWLYPYTWIRRSGDDRFILPGTRVRTDHPGNHTIGIRTGFVVQCWLDEALRRYDCHVVLDEDRPIGEKPSEMPHVVRYACASLTII